MLARKLRHLRCLGHRLTAVALLPLLLWVSLSGIGGWQCADGSPCRPALSLTCCCGVEAPPPADDCCLLEPHDPGDSQIGAACGCHLNTEQADTLLKLAAAPDGPWAMLSPAVWVPGRADSTCVRHLPPTVSHGPPRYLLSPADGRAPPVA